VPNLLTLCLTSGSFLTGTTLSLGTSLGLSLGTASLLEAHALLYALRLQGLAGGAGGSLGSWRRGRDGGRGRGRTWSLDAGRLWSFGRCTPWLYSARGLLYIAHIHSYHHLYGLGLRVRDTEVEPPQ